MRVHLAEPFPEEAFAAFRHALAAGIDVTVGPTPPADVAYLVDGTPEDISGLTSLRAVIVPYAGVPDRTCELVRQLPGVALYNLHFNAATTAEMAVGLLIAAARRIALGDRRLREGYWLGRQDESKSNLLTGRTACIYGYGEIGQRIGRVLEALEMRVVGVSRSGQAPARFADADLDEALSVSHVLVVAAPLTPQTRGRIGAREIGLLQPPRLVVNVGRAAIIDEAALFSGLESGDVAAAGLDVWYRYPQAGDTGPVPPSRFDFASLPNVVMSPHRAGNGDLTEGMRAQGLAELLNRLIAGEDVRPVDLDRGY